MTYNDFKNSVIGQLVDDGNGGYKGQCVSVIKRWISANGWPYKHGNAIDWQNNGDDFYHWIANSSTAVPVQGDIIVFKIGTYGHIGIVESANVNTVDVLNQNYPHGNLTDPVQVTRFNYTSPKVIGWLHPVDIDVTTPPAPTVDPKDQRIAELSAEIQRLNNLPPTIIEKPVDKLVENPDTLTALETARETIVELNKTILDNETTCKKDKTDLMKKLGTPLTDEAKKQIALEFIKGIFTNLFKR